MSQEELEALGATKYELWVDWSGMGVRLIAADGDLAFAIYSAAMDEPGGKEAWATRLLDYDRRKRAASDPRAAAPKDQPFIPNPESSAIQ